MNMDSLLQETEKVNEDAVRDSLTCLSLVAASSVSGRQAIINNLGLSALQSAFKLGPVSQMWAVRLLASLFRDASERGKILEGEPI